MEKPRPFKFILLPFYNFCTTTMIGSVGAASQASRQTSESKLFSNIHFEQIVAAMA